MLIDSIIGQLKSTLHEADEFLGKLMIDNRAGEITVQWRYGIAVTFQECALLRDKCPEHLVLVRLQEMLIRSHSETERTARAMGVQDRDLHPPRRPVPWFCNICHSEVSDMTIEQHAVYRHNMADAASS